MAIPAAMPAQVHKMVLFGDTGCRIWPTAAQNCSDPTQWPLARISRRIAAEKADVVVFAGDFFYRESGCPAGYQDWCGNSPPPLDPTSPSTVSTDSAYGWMADVLVPMAPMLRTAPIVIARGNHEECGRAGNGFFLLMDPRPSTAQWCTDLAQPPTSAYPVDLPVATAAAAPARTLRLVVADSANGSDTTISAAEPSLNAMYRGAASLAAPRRGRESWLLTHRPIFALVAPSIAGSGSQWTSVDQQAASYGLLGNYRMILSSHVHLVQSMQVPGQPGQLVMGNGGTELDPSPPSLPPYTTLETTTGQPVSPAYPPYPAATGFWGTSTFGYAVATPGRRPGAWSIVQRDDSGTTFARCGVTGRTINCAGASK